ncbi:hypothetical protein RND81_14G204200 [Saponaria officinalis]|uniref:DUF241 domain protein n=1 Tax=Saponaria officinalis TaxID=3572 RepID=A0AAW1GQB7_SAPOF
MATSPSHQPIRSISLPSRPHPLIPQIDDRLSRLKSSDSEVSSTSKSQLTSVGHKLSNLKQLYDCLDDFLILPQNQQKFIHFSNVKCVDELIEGSLKLLDVCGIVKDILSQVKEHIHEIQSSLRRKSNGELRIGDELDSYVNMRKNTKFLSKKCLKDVKGMVKKFNSQNGEQNNTDFATIDVLRRVEGATAKIFEFLLEIISGSKAHFHKKNGNLSNIMCKLILHQNLDNERERVVYGNNEFDEVDLIMSSISINHKKKTCINLMQIEN